MRSSFHCICRPVKRFAFLEFVAALGTFHFAVKALPSRVTPRPFTFHVGTRKASLRASMLRVAVFEWLRGPTVTV